MTEKIEYMVPTLFSCLRLLKRSDILKGRKWFIHSLKRKDVGFIYLFIHFLSFTWVNRLAGPRFVQMVSKTPQWEIRDWRVPFEYFIVIYRERVWN